jgi:formate dehydrogenase maturation protein FdhE
VNVMSELPTNFGFFAVSAGCRGMRDRQYFTCFPSATVWSPVRVTCSARKKQDSLHTRSDDSGSRGWARAHL